MKLWATIAIAALLVGCGPKWEISEGTVTACWEDEHGNWWIDVEGVYPNGETRLLDDVPVDRKYQIGEHWEEER